VRSTVGHYIAGVAVEISMQEDVCRERSAALCPSSSPPTISGVLLFFSFISLSHSLSLPINISIVVSVPVLILFHPSVIT